MAEHSDHYQKQATVLGGDKCSMAVIDLDFSKIAWRRRKNLKSYLRNEFKLAGGKLCHSELKACWEMGAKNAVTNGRSSQGVMGSGEKTQFSHHHLMI